MSMPNALEERIQEIEVRNRRVEEDKAWETSWVRRVLLSVLTYVVVLIYSRVIGASHPWLQSLVPVGGFLISTLTLSWVKEKWLEKRKGKGGGRGGKRGVLL